MFSSRNANIYSDLPPMTGGYRLLNPSASTRNLVQWHVAMTTADEIVGFTGLGDFFLRYSADDNFWILHPYSGELNHAGVFPMVSEFERSVLRDPSFVRDVLRLQLQNEVASRLGPLHGLEVYVAAPYPNFGGSGEPETFSTTDAWTFASLLGQAHFG